MVRENIWNFVNETYRIREENAKLKRLVTDLSSDKAMLRDALRKKW